MNKIMQWAFVAVLSFYSVSVLALASCTATSLRRSSCKRCDAAGR